MRNNLFKTNFNELFNKYVSSYKEFLDSCPDDDLELINNVLSEDVFNIHLEGSLVYRVEKINKDLTIDIEDFTNKYPVSSLSVYELIDFHDRFREYINKIEVNVLTYKINKHQMSSFIGDVFDKLMSLYPSDFIDRIQQFSRVAWEYDNDLRINFIEKLNSFIDFHELYKNHENDVVQILSEYFVSFTAGIHDISTGTSIEEVIYDITEYAVTKIILLLHSMCEGSNLYV